MLQFYRWPGHSSCSCKRRHCRYLWRHSVHSANLVAFAILAIRPKSRDRICGSVLKRLTIWLTAVTGLHELLLVLALVYYFNQSDVAFCKADGFLNQYFGSVHLLFTLWIILTFFFQVCEATQNPQCFEKIKVHENSKCCGCKTKVLLEGGLYFGMFTIPLITATPFAYNSYGPVGAWCWIRSVNESCNELTEGRAAQIALWTVPFVLIALLTLVLFIVALCLLCYTIKKCQLGVLNSIFTLSFLVVRFALCIVEVASRNLSIHNIHNYDTWLSYAISTPLEQLAIPLALLVAVHLPLFCKSCKRQTQYQQENASVNPSSYIHLHAPSDTHWECPHSETDEETAKYILMEVQGTI